MEANGPPFVRLRIKSRKGFFLGKSSAVPPQSSSGSKRSEKSRKLFRLGGGGAPEWARDRIVCRFDPETTEPYWALSYLFDFVLRGRNATPMEQ